MPVWQVTGRPKRLSGTSSKPVPPSRIYTLTLLALGLIAGLWAVGLYGDHVGTRLATDVAAHLSTRPEVAVYSTERIELNGPGIAVAEIKIPDTRYHYRYTGLRLLVRSSDRFLLLPVMWQRRHDRVLLLRDDDKIRVDVAVG